MRDKFSLDESKRGVARRGEEKQAKEGEAYGIYDMK